MPPRLFFSSSFLLLLTALLPLVSCGDDTKQDNPAPQGGSGQETVPTKAPKPETPATRPTSRVVTKKEKQPDRVLIDYVIIGFDGSSNPIGRERSQEEARNLATLIEQRYLSNTSLTDILLELKNTGLGSVGAGKFILLNFGVRPEGAKVKELPREKQPGLARAAFALKPGEVTIVPWDPRESPLGYWVARRLQ